MHKLITSHINHEISSGILYQLSLLQKVAATARGSCTQPSLFFFFWLCHGGYTGRTTGLTEFTLFEIVYVILLIIHKRQPNQRRQRCLLHFVRRERNKKSITFPGPSPNPNPIPITHSLNHLANKLLRTTSTPYGLNRSSARRIMNI